jgi:Protein kinase domain
VSLLDGTLPGLVEDSEDSDEEDCQHKRQIHKKTYSRRYYLYPLDHLRLYRLTGRCTRAIQAWIMIAAVLLLAGVTYSRFGPFWKPQKPSEWTAKPIMMGVYFTGVSSTSFTGIVRAIDPPHQSHRHQNRHSAKKKSHDKKTNGQIQPRLVDALSDRLHHIETDSQDYERKPEPTTHPDECEPQYKWQTMSFPTCNALHESSPMPDSLSFGDTTTNTQRHDDDDKNKSPKSLRRRQSSLRDNTINNKVMRPNHELVAHGYWRDTWLLRHPLVVDHKTLELERIAFKTLRFDHAYSEIVYDKQRRDAVTSERVQFSDHTIHMYAYCGTAALYEYAPGGNLMHYLNQFETGEDWRKAYTPAERFQLALSVTSALADLHTTESDHGSAIVHADFNANQFVAITMGLTNTQHDDLNNNNDRPPIPQFKLGDFNLSKFVYRHHTTKQPCTVKTESTGGPWRAPEEYDRHGRTEKLDIYSLGNMLYAIVTGEWPFDEIKAEKAKTLVAHGKRPFIDDSVRDSKDPYDKAILTAMDRCWKHDPRHRPSALEVKQYLEEHMPPGSVWDGGERPQRHRHRKQ